jgi:hypothetical protein
MDEGGLAVTLPAACCSPCVVSRAQVRTPSTPLVRLVPCVLTVTVTEHPSLTHSLIKPHPCFSLLVALSPLLARAPPCVSAQRRAARPHALRQSVDRRTPHCRATGPSVAAAAGSPAGRGVRRARRFGCFRCALWERNDSPRERRF